MSFLDELDGIIARRQQEMPEGSYVADLFRNGLDRVLRKVGDESGEFIIAAQNNDDDEMKNEAADLIFHVMVALRAQGLSIQDVSDVLRDRHAE